MVAPFTLQEEEISCRDAGAGGEGGHGHRFFCFKLQ